MDPGSVQLAVSDQQLGHLRSVAAANDALNSAKQTTTPPATPDPGEALGARDDNLSRVAAPRRDDASGRAWEAPLPVRPRLVLASALMLFIELALIRWTGSNIVHLSYFSNFVLLGSFLGIGLGFLRVGRTNRLPFYSPIVLATFVTFVAVYPVTVDRGTDSSVIYFTSLSTTGPPAWLILPIVFCAAAVITAGPAELVGRCFTELPRLTAYRYDLIGSLIGIGAFTALAFLQSTPIWWGVIAAAGFGLLLIPAPGARRLVAHTVLVAVPMAVVLMVLWAESVTPGLRWSPYYKIGTEVIDYGGVQALDITANGVPHQRATPAADRVRWEPQYTLPYQRSGLEAPGDVLVVGAGSGTDVAIALRNGARHVDAVEIDPVLLQLGREWHPDRPYQDPRVTTHVNDGRAFLSGHPDRRYDLVLFALPDSLTLVHGASSLRLESYLFTVEAFRSVQQHLKPGGAFAMYNYYREPWLIDRLALTAQQAFGHRPCVDDVGGGLRQAVITVGLSETAQRCGTVWPGPAAATPDPATDDRPFLYLFGHHPHALPGNHGADPRSQRGRRGSGRRRRHLSANIAVRRSVPPRRGLHAAEHKERHGIRSAVRDDLGGQRDRIRRSPARSSRRGRGHPTIPHTTDPGHVPRAVRRVAPSLACPKRLAARHARATACHGRSNDRVPADLRRERSVREAIHRHR